MSHRHPPARDRAWRRNQLLVNLALAVLGGSVPVVAVEAGLRLYHSHVKELSRYKPAANERLVFERKPHADQEINSWGMRDREYSTQKPDGVYRIVVLGDSVTDGYGVDFEERYTKKLEALLNRGPRKFEVIVLAMNQYSTVQELELLKDIGLGLSPDLVMLAYVINDPTPDGSINAFFRQDQAASLALHWIMTASRPFVPQWPPAELPRCRSFDYYSKMHCDAAKWAAVQNAFGELHALSDRHGFPVILVLFPGLEDRAGASFADYPWRSIHAQVSAEAVHHQLTVLDLLPHFSGRSVAAVKRAPEDVLHPNALGNEIAATAIYQTLVERGVVGSGP
jgi:lysophospholipase L1-like esterase